MANILEYVLSLKENLTTNLQKIGVNSDSALNKFAKLEKQSKETSNLMKDFGGSVGALRAKLNHLREERDWIPQKNINAIRVYNSEIKKLEKNINKLETINGSKLKTWGKEAFNAIPGANLITNPLVLAGTAIAATTKSALSFDEGMAKVNTTAQLSKEKLGILKSQLIGLGEKYGADMGAVPDSFESVLSVLGEVTPAMQVFETSLKGAKATGTSLGEVSKALASTQSILNDSSVTANDVLNTFLAAKRVGAGEFSDFASYMPGLISSANNLGISWKQTSGLFAYMTTKVATAADATMLMQNVFTALGKQDITDGLKAEGVLVFDKKGAMRQIEDIMGDLAARMKGMSDEQKSNFLEGVGLRDAQAKQGISAMVSDPAALKGIISQVQESKGEIEAALKNSENTTNEIKALWSKIMGVSIRLGGVFSSVLAPVLDIVSIAFDGVATVAGWVSEALGWVSNKMKEGNPIMLATAGILGSVATGMAVAWMWGQRLVAWQAVKAMWDGIVAVSTGGWASAQAALNMLLINNPVGWITASVVALIAVIGYVIYKTTGWGEAWQHVVNGSSLMFRAFVLEAKREFTDLVDWFMVGINAIKEGWYGFKNTMGIGNAADNNAAIAQIKADTERRKKEMIAGNAEVQKLWQQSKNEFSGAWGALKWDDTKTLKGAAAQLKEKLGLSPVMTTPKLPGAKLPGADRKGGGGGGAKAASEKAAKTNEAIATGGTKNTTIHITIGKQIETLTVQNMGSTKEAAADIGKVVLDEMARAIRMSQSLAG